MVCLVDVDAGLSSETCSSFAFFRDVVVVLVAVVEVSFDTGVVAAAALALLLLRGFLCFTSPVAEVFFFPLVAVVLVAVVVVFLSSFLSSSFLFLARLGLAAGGGGGCGWRVWLGSVLVAGGFFGLVFFFPSSPFWPLSFLASSAGPSLLFIVFWVFLVFLVLFLVVLVSLVVVESSGAGEATLD